MSNNDQTSAHKIGDIVWAKMSGYPFWPGKVKDPARYPSVPNARNLTNAGLVKFYGSNDHAWVKFDNMLNYEENLKKFSSTKKVRFRKAMEKCNEALKRKMQNLPDTDDEEYEVEEAVKEEEENDPVKEKPKLSKVARAKSKSGDGPTPKRRRVTSENWTEVSNQTSTPTVRSPQSVMRVSRGDQKAPSMSTIATSSTTPQNASDDALTGILALVGDKANDSGGRAQLDSSSELGGYVPQKLIPTEKKIGFIGDGIMAEPLALSLINTKHDVTVYNKIPSKFYKVANAGAKLAKSVSEVVAECDIIISCFCEASDANDMYVKKGVNSIMTSMCKGKGIIEMTTMSSASIIEYGRMTKLKGGTFLEAPFCGSRKDAEDGSVVILAGGDRNLYMQAHTCFEAMGEKTFFLGDLGSAMSTRLIFGMLSGSMMAGLGEAMSLAEKAGLDQYTLLEVLHHSNIACPMMTKKGQAILEGHFPANFPIRQQQASMRLALEMGDDLDQPLHVASAANEMFKSRKALLEAKIQEHDISSQGSSPVYAQEHGQGQ